MHAYCVIMQTCTEMVDESWEKYLLIIILSPQHIRDDQPIVYLKQTFVTTAGQTYFSNKSKVHISQSSTE